MQGQVAGASQPGWPSGRNPALPAALREAFHHQHAPGPEMPSDTWEMVALQE